MALGWDGTDCDRCGARGPLYDGSFTTPCRECCDEICAKCRAPGSGRDADVDFRGDCLCPGCACPACKGAGVLTLVGAHESGEDSSEENCRACGGSGVRA